MNKVMSVNQNLEHFNIGKLRKFILRKGRLGTGTGVKVIHFLKCTLCSDLLFKIKS